MIMPESEALKKYRNLLQEMLRIRDKYGDDSVEMEGHLDKMDQSWWDLTDIERVTIDIRDIGDRED